MENSRWKLLQPSDSYICVTTLNNGDMVITFVDDMYTIVYKNMEPFTNVHLDENELYPDNQSLTHNQNSQSHKNLADLEAQLYITLTVE